MFHPPISTVAVLAQIDGLGAKFSGLATQAVAGLLAIVVAFGTVILLWKLMASMASNPSAHGLLSIVGVLLLAVALAGATPDLMDAAYEYGGSFLDSTQ